MKQFLSLLKATMKGDMNIFAIRSKKNSKIGKVLLPVFLSILLFYSVGYYAYQLAKPLNPYGLTFIVLTLFVMITTIFIFMEGVYKSQGILFEAKDNDLLFSLPISKSKIFFTRIIKVIVFEYLFTALFFLPAVVIYAYFDKPSFAFYPITLLMFILIPIIPTIISSIIGYIIEWLTSLFKNKRLFQNIFSIIYTLLLFYALFSIDGLFNNIAEKATSLNDLITKIYYPLGLYINLITEFNIVDLIILLLINIVPFILFIYLFSLSYFNIISKLKDKNKVKSVPSKVILGKKSSPLKALIKKEIKRYLSSSIYIFNTIFGVVFIFIISILSLFNTDIINKAVNTITESSVSIELVNQYMPLFVLVIIAFVTSTVSITASSISLEGKSYNLTKSLPIKGETLLLSKILSSMIITVPFLLISDICLIISLDLELIYIITIILSTILLSALFALLDLIINLKYPKMDFKSDVEVVKQSASSLISILANMGFAVLLIFFSVYLMDHISILLMLYINLSIITVLIVLLIIYIIKKGNELLMDINI